MEVKEYGGFSEKKLLNFWNFALVLFLLLGIIGVSSTIYQELTRQREINKIQTRLQELQDQAQQQYQLQNAISATHLSQSPEIQAFFTLKGVFYRKILFHIIMPSMTILYACF